MKSTKLMQLYFDGQLDEADRLRVEQILKEDPKAGAELRDYEKLRAALQTAASPAGEISQPDFMWSRVKEAVERGDTPIDEGDRERTPWWNWDYRWAFSGVAAGVLLALGLIFWSQKESPVALRDDKQEGYSSVTVYTFDPNVYPAEYLSRHAKANVIWLTGVDAYGQNPEKM